MCKETPPPHLEGQSKTNDVVAIFAQTVGVETASNGGVRFLLLSADQRMDAATNLKGQFMVKPNPDQEVAELALADLADEELVTSHLSGRPGAFQELYDRYRDRLIHFITRKTGDPDRAQDLVQEAFIRVTRHLHRFDTSKKFSTWVYTIASNLSKNELRNRSRSPLVLFQRLTNNWDDDHRPLQFEDFSMRPDDLFRKRFLRRLVEDTVKELPEHHRLVFRLRELEGKSYEEISEITGVNLGTVKSRLHRARNSFAQRIEPFLN